MQFIGVTGTNGKSSCAYLLSMALTRLNHPCGMIGTLGYGFYHHLEPSPLTTPDAKTLATLFPILESQGAETVVMEVSSHGLQQNRVKDVPFRGAIFTNLTRDHLDYHKTVEAYQEAKAKLFKFPSLEFAVINADDPFGQTLIKQHPDIAIAYSRHSAIPLNIPCQTVVTEFLRIEASGITADILTPWGHGRLTTPLLGAFNYSNVLAILSTLCALNIPFQDALEQIAHISSVPGRMQVFGGGQQPIVIIDYAHTPDALLNVLSTLKSVHSKGRLYCLFGCGGDRDTGKRPEMAKIVEEYADKIVVTDDNPRFENPDLIIQSIFSGFHHPENVMIERDRAKAIQNIIHAAQPGDCILIAGKGAETTQEIAGVRLAYSDIDTVTACLNGTSS